MLLLTVRSCVQEKGGSITHEDVARVEGVLAVTRAFGNNAMKRVIDAEPELRHHAITAGDEFIIIASDGVWDLLSNEAAVRRCPCARPRSLARSLCAAVTRGKLRLSSVDSALLSLPAVRARATCMRTRLRSPHVHVHMASPLRPLTAHAFRLPL
jgi:Protein phosphatase 2C